MIEGIGGLMLALLAFGELIKLSQGIELVIMGYATLLFFTLFRLTKELKYLTWWIVVLYGAVCLFKPLMLMVLPIIYYEIKGQVSRPAYIVFLVISFVAAVITPGISPIHMVLQTFLANLLFWLEGDVIETQNKYIESFDNATEIHRRLEAKNRALITNQNFERNNAILTERNRIARDIHDHIGHLLSRCILQIGALEIVISDDSAKTALAEIGDTLQHAMNEVRDSIHNVHRTTISLEKEITETLKHFDYCDVQYDYRLYEEPSQEITLGFIAIIREALNNVTRHSKATKVKLRLWENPTGLHCVIADNGIGAESEKQDAGIGLYSITKRVEALNGRLHINDEKGFTLYIIINKEGVKDEHSGC